MKQVFTVSSVAVHSLLIQVMTLQRTDEYHCNDVVYSNIKIQCSPDGLIVSLGSETKSGVSVSELTHNEIVVYAPEQVLIRYLLKVKFVPWD